MSELDEEEMEVRVDGEGQRVGVLKPRATIDKKVAYYAFDKEAEDHARRVSYINEVGPLGILEKRMEGDRRKSSVSRAEYEYALFCAENPWYMTGVHAPAGRPRWQVIALAFGFGVVLVAVLYASITRPSSDRRPPEAAPEAPQAALERQGRVDHSPPEPNAK